MSDTTLDILVRVRERLSDPKRWTKHAYAFRPWGKRKHNTRGTDPAATQWCLLGAIQAEIGLSYLPLRCPEVSALVDCLPPRRHTISGFNDDPKTTHADVLAVLSCAIERARAAS